MGATQTTFQRQVFQTCVSCEQKQWFEAQDASKAAFAVLYECIDCGHESVLLLDPGEGIPE